MLILQRCRHTCIFGEEATAVAGRREKSVIEWEVGEGTGQIRFSVTARGFQKKLRIIVKISRYARPFLPRSRLLGYVSTDRGRSIGNGPVGPGVTLPFDSTSPNSRKNVPGRVQGLRSKETVPTQTHSLVLESQVPQRGALPPSMEFRGLGAVLACFEDGDQADSTDSCNTRKNTCVPPPLALHVSVYSIPSPPPPIESPTRRPLGPNVPLLPPQSPPPPYPTKRSRQHPFPLLAHKASRRISAPKSSSPN